MLQAGANPITEKFDFISYFIIKSDPKIFQKFFSNMQALKNFFGELQLVTIARILKTVALRQTASFFLLITVKLHHFLASPLNYITTSILYHFSGLVS